AAQVPLPGQPLQSEGFQEPAPAKAGGSPLAGIQRGREAVIFCRPAGSNIENRLAKLVSTPHGTARSPTGLENSPPNGSVHRLHPGENEKRKNSQALCPGLASSTQLTAAPLPHHHPRDSRQPG